MKTFLQYVAQDILAKHGTNLAQTAVVFPNKRAALFLNQYLAQQAGKPIWSPSYTTISDLFRQQSPLAVADSIKLICDLHKVYNDITGRGETLDQFYGWGQILLEDFDDIDKNLADAQKVFANIEDLHELDSVAYLSEEQKRLLEQFFGNFRQGQNTELKQKFLTLWNKLRDVYEAFNQRLEHQGLTYEGALYRRVVESEENDFKYERYIFVGFNLLQKVEQQLFKRLKQEGKALFYWDFDRYYLQSEHEAGHYIRQYLDRFPNELDNTDADIYDNLTKPKEITYVSAPTENVQAHYIAHWLREEGRKRIEQKQETAIVLCNENLLQAVTHCLPPEVKSVNITTGYPLAKTPFASLLNALLKWVSMPTQKNERQLRQHPYAHFFAESEELMKRPSDTSIATLSQWLTDIVRHIGTHSDNSDDAFFTEALFRTYTLLNRLRQLILDGDLDANTATFQRLLNQLIASTTIPFHGEPIEGLQVMGLLETRNLDFKHLLVLSCNEGNIPQKLNSPSFIPYSIRKAYGLTTIDHKTSIYAYYFHALLQRAEDVTIVYNKTTDEGKQSEMSRFMLQLMSQEEFRHIQQKTLVAPVATPKTKTETTADEAKTLPFEAEMLSPTDLGRYLRCPRQFYYSKVAAIPQPDQDEDSLDNRLFGNVFHKAAQLLYDGLLQDGSIKKDDIAAVLKDPRRIENIVSEAFREEKAVINNRISPLHHAVITDYLRRLLTIDQKLAPFSIIGNEHRVRAQYSVDGRKIVIGGIIDRLDLVTDSNGERRIRVVDYKTGSQPQQTVASVEEIFDPACITKKHSDYFLQTMLYATIVAQNHEGKYPSLPVAPALIFIQHTAGDDYDPTLVVNHQKISDIRACQPTFGEHLQGLLSDILNPENPFTPTDEQKRCTYCPYKKICKS